MWSRDLANLDPSIRYNCEAFLAECSKKGLNVIVTCTSRDHKLQAALYSQGRDSLEVTNRMRSLAGMSQISEERNKKKVTWTFNSKHIVNRDDDDLFNDLSMAFDFCIVRDKKAMWDIKADVNENEIPDYEECGRIAEALGLTWGGRWKKPDYCHVQV